MTVYQFVFQPTTRAPSIRDDGPEQVLATGTLAECQQAWRDNVTGHYRDYEQCESIGLLYNLGNIYSFHQGGSGSYSIRMAPELTENPTYEVRPAADATWTPAGETLAEAEVAMRRMGKGPSDLLVLRNNFNNSLFVYETNNLGYLTPKGTYEQFYGSTPRGAVS
jgi:hypothetical protein